VTIVLADLSIMTDRWVKGLCIALTFVFAAVNLSAVVDRIQHTPGAAISHQHMIFSEFSFELEHGEDHHAADMDSPAGHLPGGHHHHGDSGSGVILTGALAAAELPASLAVINSGPEQRMSGVRLADPDRPPKAFALNV
jgi:hypothetical protein